MPSFAIRCLLTLAIALGITGVAPAQTSGIQLPDIGDSAGSVLSPAEEHQLGAELVRELRRSHPPVDDPYITDYIEHLGAELTLNADSAVAGFEFFVVDDPTINAFALPGGFIGVHTGLVLATQSESELAAVLAHEIAHVTQHHIARTFEEARKLNLPTLGALLAALAIAGSSAEAGRAAITAVAAGSTQAQLNFTRANEQEADRVGIAILAHSALDPHAMPAFFERMAQANRFQGNQLPEFLRSHPVTDTRIADSRARADQYGYRQSPDSMGYQLVRMKLQLREEPNPTANVRRLKAQLATGQYLNETAAHYGYAQALLDAGDVKAATAEIERLREKHPDEIAFIIAASDAAAAAGDNVKAMASYESAMKLYPGSRALVVGYANLAMKNGKAAKARDRLRAALGEHPDDPTIHRLLAQAQSAAGDLGAAYQAQAEYLYLTGDIRGAIRQLENARRLQNNDFYQASKIEARLAELKREAKDKDKDKDKKGPGDS